MMNYALYKLMLQTMYFISILIQICAICYMY